MLGIKLNISRKLKVVLSFFIAVAFLGFFAFHFGPLNIPYLVGFIAGTIEVLLLAIYLYVIKNYINSNLRRKVNFYIGGLFALLLPLTPVVIFSALSGTSLMHSSIVFSNIDTVSHIPGISVSEKKICTMEFGAYVTALFVWFSLWALILALVRFTKRERKTLNMNMQKH